MPTGVFLVFQACLLLGRRKWDSCGEVVETCFGVNRAANWALSTFPVALQMAFMWRTKGEMLALRPWCIPGMTFPAANCLNSGFGVWEGAVVFSGCDREHLPVTWPIGEHQVGHCCFIFYVWMKPWQEEQFQLWCCCIMNTHQPYSSFKPFSTKFPELFQEMSILWFGG